MKFSESPAGKGLRRAGVAGALALSVWSAPLAHAANVPDDWDVQSVFVERLIEQKWYPLAHDQIAEMRKEFKSATQQHELHIMEADVFIAERKREKALESLGKVPQNSRSYPAAVLLSAKLEDTPADKEKKYAEYFKRVREPKGAREEAQYRSAIVSSATNLMSMGNSKAAQARLALLSKVVSEDGGAAARSINLQIARLLLDAAADAKKDGKDKKEYGEFVKSAEEKLADLQWEMDALAAFSYVESARAHLIMERYDELNQQINEPALVQFLRSVEEGLIKEGVGRGASPLAGIYYYNGEANLQMAMAANAKGKKAKTDAQKAEARDETINYLKAAAHSLFRVVKDYGKSPYKSDATAKFGEVKAALGAFDIQFENVGAGADISIWMEQAAAAYQDKDFGKAADLFEKALKADPLGRDVPDIGRKLVVCYLQAKRYLSASVYADFLGTQFPDDPNTHDALYITGAFLSKVSRDAEAAGMQELADANRGYSNAAYIRLVEVASDYPKASFAGWQVAETFYSDAMEARREARELEDAGKEEEAEAKDAEMHNYFRQAVPVYESLARNHGQSPHGVLSYYKLGWVYLFLEEDEPSATNFVLYTEADESKTSQRATAKFRAAERFMRADQNDAAIQHFQEYLDWTSGNDYPMNEQLIGFRNDASAYIAWCYDRRAKAMEEKVTYYNNEIAQLKEKIESGEAQKEYQAVIDAAGDQEVAVETPDQRLETLNASLKEAQEEAAKMRKEAIDMFVAYIDNNPTDERQVPSMMVKLGNLFAKRGDMEKSNEWFMRLQTEYGHTDQGKTSRFLLLVQLVEAGQDDEAGKLADDLAKQVDDGEFTPSQVSAIANMMITEDDATGEDKVISLRLAEQANEALIEQAKGNKDGTALLSYNRLAKAYFIVGELDKVVATVDRAMAYNDKTPFYFTLQYLKGESLARQNKVREAIVVFGEAINLMGDKTAKYKDEYYKLTEASVRLRLDQDNATDVRKGVAEGMAVVKYQDLDDPDIQPYIESILYHYTIGLSLLGMTADAEQYQAEYIRRFPEGKYKRDIMALPPKKY